MDNKTKQQKKGKTKGENNPVGQLVEQQIAQSQSERGEQEKINTAKYKFSKFDFLVKFAVRQQKL